MGSCIEIVTVNLPHYQLHGKNSIKYYTIFSHYHVINMSLGVFPFSPKIIVSHIFRKNVSFTKFNSKYVEHYTFTKKIERLHILIIIIFSILLLSLLLTSKLDCNCKAFSHHPCDVIFIFPDNFSNVLD